MKAMTQSFAVLFLSMTLLFPMLTGCEQEGPAERAGEAVDEATENAGDAIEDAGESVQDAAN